MIPTYVAVDVETTGLDPDYDVIIEVAAVTFRDGQIVDEWSSLVNPRRAVPAAITHLTGITQEMVDGAPGMATLRPRLKRILGDHVLVGHNVGFDLGFLRAENLGVAQHRVDTLTLASILLPTAGRYGLDALATLLELPGREDRRTQEASSKAAHRALNDAHRTTALFLALYQRAVGLDFDILDEIVRAGNNLGWPETIFFEEALRAAGKQAFGRARGQLDKLFKPEKVLGRPLIAAQDTESIDVKAISAMLRPGGNFSRLFPGFEHRPQQVEMSQAVANAFNEGQQLIVEAGTGTGKSIGYLLPAAFWANENGRRVVISTNTINLQDQLLHKDLPDLQNILPFELRAAVLKGKRNYLCTRLFQQMRHSGPNSADEMALYARILAWLPYSASGDLAEVNLRTPGERLAWGRLSAENDACTMDRCAQENCPLHIARRRAEQAHILVVNHALLLADIASDNRVLPEYLDLVVDEAHHLESAVTEGLSFRADKRFLESILEEVVKPRAGLVADLQRRAAAALPGELSSVIDGYANRLRETGQQATLRLDDFFTTLAFFLDSLVNKRSQYAEQIRFTPELRRQPGFEQVVMSWDNLERYFRTIGEGFGKLAGGLADLSEGYDIEDGEELRLALLSLARSLEEARINLDALVAQPAETVIYWAEVYRERLSLHAAPLHIGPLVEKYIFQAKETVVLTSATLRTAGPQDNGRPSFSYLRDRLHAQDCEELAVGSPFDYQATTLVYLPTDIPEPNQPGYQRYVEGAIVEVAQALGGRTMVLFTSYGHLLTTAQAVERPLAEAGISLLAQTEGSSRQHLLDQFKTEDSRAVLLGTRSFWEGVDVPGMALQAVVIAKLPFDVPSDPIFAARSETFENSFMEYAIPEAVLRFRQGFGRLIRRQDDQGVVVILDKRVLTKRYGQAFLDALPECTVLRQRAGRVGELTLRWLNR
ncbi:MAG: DEAD/DEAH box helicase family protein [Chloroflexi bacterium]|nr:DEAD/DEAH box helicase family protein [Chloroflexota bacterium]MCI0579476.1 DEAD/DEAH box helicase family protein [Chloroflexota bacterium]MCI0646253.1 DEAD/DEAH box helicase family protein [Chloroflexota bacterium]MCI0732127.1 DEAD/DEAH box helicase family protein [Chloroflexota bacterium]